MESTKDFEGERQRLTRRVWGVTTAYTGLLFILTASVVFGQVGVDSFRKMRPNEVGDLLAGIAGPLAFIWLVYGYFLQGIAIRQQAEELRQNTSALQLQEKALREQANELRNSVTQQFELVKLTKEQLDMEREKVKGEKEALRNTLLPVLSLEIHDSRLPGRARTSHLQENKRLEFELFNSGSVAVDINIESTESQVMVVEDAIQVLKSEGQYRFGVLIAEGADLSDVRLNLHFSDIAGNKYCKSFALTFHPDDIVFYGIRPINA
jgi:hypothetical protein